jgi:phosphoserine aminotransferase
MNFLPPGGSADYILTGSWGKKALKEAKRAGVVNVAANMADGGFTRIPGNDELTLDAKAAYVHITSNETIEGVEWKKEPEVGDVPLIADASSDILSHPIPVDKYALIYAGAQKNMGPSGVTLVIVRDDLLKRIPDGLHTMLDFRTHVENKSLYNTPNTWGIYILSLVCKWLLEKGGLTAMHRENEEKASLLYDAIDATDFYRGHADPDSRSIMNVTFRLPSEELEKRFAAEATAQGLDGLKGHRSVGGIRASIYNAFPLAGVKALVAFMKEFETQNG